MEQRAGDIDVTSQPSFLRGALGLLAVATTLFGLLAISACPPSLSDGGDATPDDDDVTADDDDATPDDDDVAAEDDDATTPAPSVGCPEDDPWEPNDTEADGFPVGSGEDDADRILCPGNPDVFVGRADQWTSIEFSVITDDPESIEVDWDPAQGYGKTWISSQGLGFFMQHGWMCPDVEDSGQPDAVFVVSLSVPEDAEPVAYTTTSWDDQPCGDE